jgi:ATP-dependent RNA helicase RhlE
LVAAWREMVSEPQMAFTALGLAPDLSSAVDSMGYTIPTPIQTDAIPFVLEGRDVVGCAQTGTGKTAAFILPTLQRISRGHGTKALVVTPTRELALQIEEVGRAVGHHTRHSVVAVYGGVGYEGQAKRVRRGADLIVATPGRLLDMMNRRDVDLSRVEVLVLDEADRMLDMGFWPDVRRILQAIPARRQNLLFSATMSPEVLRIIGDTLHDPVRVEVAKAGTTIEATDQSLYPVNAMQKTDLLVELLKQSGWDKVLVFTRTKHRADRVARQLTKRGVNAAAIHGDRSQGARQEALAGFKNGRIPVLVATDIVARGIDVDMISHVINYDLPNSAEDYVHRIGRTARAGHDGSAVTLMAPEEELQLRAIERLIGLTLPARDLDGFAYGDRIVPAEDRAAKKPSLAYGGRVLGRRRRGPSALRRR